jgi:HD superfamily phosphohydrolase
MTKSQEPQRDNFEGRDLGNGATNLSCSRLPDHAGIRSIFFYTAEQAAERRQRKEAYALSRQHESSPDYKNPNREVLMRDALHPDGIVLHRSNPLHKVIIDLMDTPVVQRLKDVGQLSYADVVYKDARHYRFNHVLGSAYLTANVLENLRAEAARNLRLEIERWGPAVVAFAMLHDVGHIAPRSHIAQHVWYPGQKDAHEELSKRIVREHPGLRWELDHCIDKYPTLSSDLEAVMAEDPSNSAVPRWTWQLVTGGGWNTDRGDWVARDSEFCGVNYGRYDLPVLKKNLEISTEGDLVIREAGIAPMNSFFNARKDMYVNVYAHTTVRIAGRIATMVGQRARELFAEDALNFADPTMQEFLKSQSIADLSLQTALNMVESNWVYHLHQWALSDDVVLRELSEALLLREIPKHAHDPEGSDESNGNVSPFWHASLTRANEHILTEVVRHSGRDPRYYVIKLPEEKAVDMKKDLSKALKVSLRGGQKIVELSEASAEMNALGELGAVSTRPRLAAPVWAWPDIKVH